MKLPLASTHLRSACKVTLKEYLTHHMGRKCGEHFGSRQSHVLFRAESGALMELGAFQKISGIGLWTLSLCFQEDKKVQTQMS